MDPGRMYSFFNCLCIVYFPLSYLFHITNMFFRNEPRFPSSGQRSTATNGSKFPSKDLTSECNVNQVDARSGHSDGRWILTIEGRDTAKREVEPDDQESERIEKLQAAARSLGFGLPKESLARGKWELNDWLGEREEQYKRGC